MGGLLGSSVLIILALARAGSVLFWKSGSDGLDAGPTAIDAPVLAGASMRLAVVGLLLASTVLMSALAGPLTTHADRVASDLMTPARYVEAVLGAGTAVAEVKP